MEARAWKQKERGFGVESHSEPWAPGPWDHEPDKLQWVDEATGLPCLIVRNRMGALCGYVGITRAHPLYGVDYGYYRGCPDEYLNVHGGITFSGACAKPRTEDADEAGLICHVPDPGEPHDVWWFGFDCNHSGDFAPGMDALHRWLDKNRPMPGLLKMIDLHSYETYRDVWYVKDECAKLASQLHILRPSRWAWLTSFVRRPWYALMQKGRRFRWFMKHAAFRLLKERIGLNTTLRQWFLKFREKP